ncbi:MAG: hypothetical protein ACE5HD_11170 [Acidobacteriota bacterium]
MYQALLAGEEKERRQAPWRQALATLAEHRGQLEQGPGLERQVGLLQELVVLLERTTLLNRFPVRRVAEVHSALHLLRACQRAAARRLAMAAPGA